MPELPEVETVVRGVRPLAVGRTILDVVADWPGVVRAAGAPTDVETFRARVAGRRVVAVRRRAKLLILDLAEADGPVVQHLVFHLKMTGNLFGGPAA